MTASSAQTAQTAQTAQSQQVPPWIWLILILISTALLGLSLWFGLQFRQDQNHTPLFAPKPGCQLPQYSCTATNQGRSIRFAIQAKQLNSHQPMPVRVELEGYNATRVTIKLQGVEMYMGENKTTLERHRDGSYQANIQLPVCTTGTMLWRAQILITSPSKTNQTGEISGSWFDFEAG